MERPVPRVHLEGTPEGPIKAFFDALHQLHRYAGEPSTRKVADATGGISHTAIYTALSGKRGVPSWPTVQAIVQVLRGDVELFRRLWVQARDVEDAASGSPHARTAGAYGHADALAAIPIVPVQAQRPTVAEPAEEPPVDRRAVLLVDDHDLIRKGLRYAFEHDGQFEVVGETGTAAEAVRLAAQLKPDVIMMDLRLPDGSGLEATRTIRKSDSTVGIVVFTMYAGDDQLFGALEAGASAFAPKSSPADEVVAAARHAADNPSAFTAADLADAMKRRLAPSGPQLSPREGQVLRLLADGMSVAGIARQLFVSETTAKTHISKLYEKLGAANRAQALMTALRLGLLEAPDSPRF